MNKNTHRMKILREKFIYIHFTKQEKGQQQLKFGTEDSSK